MTACFCLWLFLIRIFKFERIAFNRVQHTRLANTVRPYIGIAQVITIIRSGIISFQYHTLSSRTGNGGSPCGRPMNAPTAQQFIKSRIRNRSVRHGVACVPEQKCNAPDCGKSDKDVNNTAYDSCLSAANPRNKIKLKNTDTSPVESAYNKKRQCYFIEHSKSSFVFAENSIDAFFRFIQFKLEFN